MLVGVSASGLVLCVVPWYDYELYSAREQKLKLQARGHRRLLSHNLPFIRWVG